MIIRLKHIIRSLLVIGIIIMNIGIYNFHQYIDKGVNITNVQRDLYNFTKLVIGIEILLMVIILYTLIAAFWDTKIINFK